MNYVLLFPLLLSAKSQSPFFFFQQNYNPHNPVIPACHAVALAKVGNPAILFFFFFFHFEIHNSLFIIQYSFSPSPYHPPPPPPPPPPPEKPPPPEPLELGAADADDRALLNEPLKDDANVAAPIVLQAAP